MKLIVTCFITMMVTLMTYAGHREAVECWLDANDIPYELRVTDAETGWGFESEWIRDGETRTLNITGIQFGSLWTNYPSLPRPTLEDIEVFNNAASTHDYTNRIVVLKDRMMRHGTTNEVLTVEVLTAQLAELQRRLDDASIP